MDSHERDLMADPKRILIIEDEPDIVRGLTDALEFEGFEVAAASNGADGLDLAAETDPHCVLLDLMLPDENGYHKCQYEFHIQYPFIAFRCSPIVSLLRHRQGRQ